MTGQVIAVSISWPLHPAEKVLKSLCKNVYLRLLKYNIIPIGSMYGIYMLTLGVILMVNVTIAYMDPIGLIITDMHHSKLEAKCSEISEPNPEDPQLKPQLSYRIPQCAPSCAMLCPPLGSSEIWQGKVQRRHCWNPWSTLWSSGTTWTSPMIRAATTPLRRRLGFAAAGSCRSHDLYGLT